MPITNNASYVPTMDEFVAHWNVVNATLPAPLQLNVPGVGGVSAAAFAGLRDEIDAANISVIDKLNDQQIARGDIELKKAQLLAWLGMFNGILDSYYQGTSYLNARPKVPGISEGQDRFLSPMHDMASLWSKLDAAAAPPGVTLPLTLADGTTQAQAQAAISALRVAYLTEKTALQSVALARGQRDIAQEKAYASMKVYRTAVPTVCAEHPELVATLPRLTPEGGHTPDPVNASAVFEAPDKSKVVYEASEDAALLRYELRGNPGAVYDEADAVVVATHAPDDAREFVTTFGLTQPGTAVALKVYVVLNSGNEAGSATMVVERPT